jgi:hypothetical protein
MFWPVIRAAEPQSLKSEPPRAWLLDVVSVSQPLDREPAKRFFQYVRHELSRDVEIDWRALTKVLGKNPEHMPVTVRSQNQPIGLAIERVANRLGGTVTWDGDKVRIVPGSSRGYSRFLRPATKKTSAIMNANVEIGTDIEDVPLRDVLIFLGDKTDITILIDESDIRRPELGVLEVKRVAVPAGVSPLGQMLRKLAETVGCTVQVFEGLILLVPRSGKLA